MGRDMQLRETCGATVRAAVDAQNALHTLHVLQSSNHVGPPPPRLAPGRRGIVICAGGAKYMACAYVNMAVLRASGCMLPIELWHVGEDERPENAAADLQQRFHPLRCVDAAKVLPKEDYDAAREQHYAIKPLAVVHSSFDEVMLLDADNHAVKDPTDMFDTQQGYVRCGAMFWPDFHPFPRNCLACLALADSLPDAPSHTRRGSAVVKDSKLGDALTQQGKLCPLWQQESGQLIVDRRRCAAALRALRDLTLGWRALYPTLPGAGGDKDTFQLAWYVARQPFAWGPRISAVGRASPSRGRGQHAASFFAGNTMLHRDEQGALRFAHKNLYKWAPGMRADVDAHRAWKLVVYSAPDHRGELLPQCINGSGEPVPPALQELETRGFAYLRDLEDIPWFEDLCLTSGEAVYSHWARARDSRRKRQRRRGRRVRDAHLDVAHCTGGACRPNRDARVAAVGCLVVGLLLAAAASAWLVVAGVRSRSARRS